MKCLSADDILNSSSDINREKYEIEEWGGFVYIQTMSAEALDAYEDSIYVKDDETGKYRFDKRNATAKLIAACVVDQSGERIFPTTAHINELGKKNAQILKRLWRECQRVNGLSIADAEETEGKSETAD